MSDVPVEDGPGQIHWEPKYVKEWSADQKEMDRLIMELVDTNHGLERDLASYGVQSVPWLAIKLHTDAMQWVYIENPTGLQFPGTERRIGGDERETRLLVFRYYYQRTVNDELTAARSGAARAKLMGGVNGPIPEPQPNRAMRGHSG